MSAAVPPGFVLMRPPPDLSDWELFYEYRDGFRTGIISVGHLVGHANVLQTTPAPERKPTRRGRVLTRVAASVAKSEVFHV
jgi:hypothetical protein